MILRIIIGKKTRNIRDKYGNDIEFSKDFSDFKGFMDVINIKNIMNIKDIKRYL